MRQNSTLYAIILRTLVMQLLIVLLLTENLSAQITLALGSPTNHIYGLTSNGVIYEINTSNGSISATIKNNSYSGASPSNSNGLAYNTVNGKFYYFKRNLSSGSQEFVSFYPTLGVVSTLAASTCSADIHTGTVTNDGKYYYTIDIQGNLNCYDISANTWKKITSTIVDQYGNDVDAVIRSQNAGDIAVDGSGNIWVLTSSTSNYGLYKISYPAPTGVVASLTVRRIIAPTASTPTGNSFAGIAFDANGQIYLGTRGDDKLYLLQNQSTLTFIGNFGASDAGNDLTSMNFPSSVLPVKWISFNASAQNSNINLDWKVIEQQNKGFYIQHSEDGKSWEDIDFIKSRNIPESEELYTYSYSASLTGRQYYRIKQVDIDGRESFSVIRVLNFTTTSNSTMAAWPNPARNVINIDNQGAKTNTIAKAQIFDLSGKLNMEKQLQQGVNSIDISSLPSGAYIVKTNNSLGDSFTQKIIKQ